MSHTCFPWPHRLARTAALAIVVALVAACGSSGATTSVAPSGSGSGPTTVSLEVDPNPAAVNQEARLTLRLTDGAGNGVAGVKVAVTAEHSDMSMGQISGIVADAGNGNYTTSITPTMSGKWKVNVTVESGGATKQKTFEFSVN